MQSPAPRDNDASISVIICAYTELRWDDIVSAIESIRQQTLSAHEIILVIDHNPALLERARACFDDVLIVDNTSARGLSGARNTGLVSASGTFVAFLDDDAAAAPDWLERLYSDCADPNVLGAGGLVEANWVQSQPEWFPEEFLWVVGCSYRGLPRSKAVVRNPFGGCSCFRREVFDQLGGFRTEIGRVGTRPLGCEETELAVRAGQRWPDRWFIHDPDATIRHKVPAWRGTVRYFVTRCYGEGLSKAWLANHLGSRDGLASERAYVTQVLPAGILRAILVGTFGRQPAKLGRAGAIILGLTCTVAGYLVGMVGARWRWRSAATASARPQPESAT